MVLFYCGINETKWHGWPVAAGERACVSPVYGKSQRTYSKSCVYVPAGTKVIQDCGAFPDRQVGRVTYQQALDRQRRHADEYEYADMIEYRAVYDTLIDFHTHSARRYHPRWTRNNVQQAIAANVEACEFLLHHSSETPLIMTAQGATPDDYNRCAEQIYTLMRPCDCLGLGGWVFMGKMRSLAGVFVSTMQSLIPAAGTAGVRRIHLWGVIYPEMLGQVLYLCDQVGIVFSTDSAGPAFKPAFGSWGYAEWRNNAYRRAAPEQVGFERTWHVAQTREYLANLRSTAHYRQPGFDVPNQLKLF